MGVVNIRALLDWKNVQTGLQNIKGQMQRVGAEANKGFSLGSLARNFLGAFVGVNLVSKLVEPFKMAADYAERMSSAVASMRELSLAGIMQRNTPERNLGVIDREMRGNDARLAQIDAALKELPDFSDPNWIKLGLQNPELANPFVLQAKKSQFDSLLAERNDLASKQQGLANDRAAIAREAEVAARRGGYETSALYDQRKVARGDMSQIEALQNAADRATSEYMTVLRTRGRGAESTAAFNAMLQAQNALIPAEAAADRARINGVLPQISSSSLAQLGGGGNVNVFGGRAGEGATELREQTRLLRSIDSKIRARGNTIDVGF